MNGKWIWKQGYIGLLAAWEYSDTHCLQTSFWYLNFANHRTKESFVSTISDVLASIAIGLQGRVDLPQVDLWILG